MIVTDHAARRYVKRLARGLSVEDALGALRRASLTATRREARTFKGQQLWETSGCGGAVLVVKHDPEAGLVVVTVIGPNEEAPPDEEHDVLAAFERAQVATQEQPKPAKPETWREKYDRLNREAEAAEKRAAERRARHLAHLARMRVEREASAKKKAARSARRFERIKAKWRGGPAAPV